MPHVLVVDDDHSLKSVLSRALSRAGYRVSTADDGEAALAICRDDRPDVVVTDLRMPRMDGREFVRRVLEHDRHAMILVLTGFGSIEETVELMRSGVYYVLTKPIGADDIRFMVENAVRESELRRRSADLEKRLEISERLAMIGKLAAGVAHELNNPLDGVIRFVKLTLEGLPEGSEGRDFQDAALQGLKRMSSIVKDLLTFSRNIALEIEEEEVEHLLREAEASVRASRPGRAVEVRYDLALPEVTVPRGLFQVFQNILANSFDAVADGGAVRISAGLRDGDVLVAFRDDGRGIPPEVVPRVFEPFFTTKEVGKGTGLGLSIVSRIMERFGGGVDLESVVGEGTTVTVFLPRSPRARGERRHEPAERTSLHPAR